MSSPGLSSLWWFLAVIALIPLVLWLLKRTPLGGFGSGVGAPRTVSVLPLSASQKLVTIEVGQGDERLWLVLGVTAQSIRTLHTMAPQQAGPGSAAPAPVAATAFAQLLSRMRQTGAPDDAR